MQLKLTTYLKYLLNYITVGDWTSVKAALTYVVKHKIGGADRTVKSKLGHFFVRGGTTDFMYINPAYEYQLKDFVKQYSSKFYWVFDIGACIGDFSIWAAKQGKQVMAFEPMPSNYQSLTTNIKLNNLENKVFAFNSGLSNDEDQLMFEERPDNKGASKATNNPTKATHIVSVCPLDDMLIGFKMPKHQGIMLKIDVEGMEHKVLEGAKHLLKQDRPMLLVLEYKLADTQAIDKALKDTGNWKKVKVDSMNTAFLKNM